MLPRQLPVLPDAHAWPPGLILRDGVVFIGGAKPVGQATGYETKAVPHHPAAGSPARELGFPVPFDRTSDPQIPPTRLVKIVPVPTLIAKPSRVEAAGNKPKLIDEYIGRVNSGTAALSVAHMRSPGGWQEPGQTPEFDEFTIVLRGMLRVEFQGGTMDVAAGQAVIAHQGEWVRYSTPGQDGAEYIAVCLPAFSPQTVHRG